MSFESEVLADSPAYWHRMGSYSSGFADSSGNGFNLDTLSGTAPTIVSGGPKLATRASWGASSGFIRTSHAATSPTVGTYVFSIEFAATPAADLCLATFCPIPNNVNGGCTAVYLLTSGKVRLFLFDGSSHNLDTLAALSTGTQYQVAVSWGAAGSDIRVNQGDVTLDNSGATTSAVGITGSSFRVHGYYNGSSDGASTGAVKLAEMRFFPTQLTHTRSDAQAAAAPTTAGSFAATVPASSASFAGGYVPPLLTGSFAGSLPKVTADLAGTYSPAVVPGTFTGSLPTVRAALAGAYLGPHPSDASNSRGGLDILCTATVTLTRPSVAPSNLAPRHDKAVPLPPPTLVDGRVT